MAEQKGKLKGQVVLITVPRRVPPQDEAALERLSERSLAERAEAPEPREPITIDFANPKVPKDPDERRRYEAHAPQWVRDKIREQQRELQYRSTGSCRSKVSGW